MSDFRDMLKTKTGDVMKEVEKIVVLTGAGLSAESGLGTFRDKGGLWAQYDLNEVATPEGFLANPDKVHEFYNMRRKLMIDAVPNMAHIALARLEKHFAGQVVEITQNIDDMLEKAGCMNVLHMHGTLFEARCMACHVVMQSPPELSTHMQCTSCERRKTLRPNVVWFGEIPMHMDEIANHLVDCDLFLSIGTSGTVYPAAGFVIAAKEAGAWTVEINLEPADNSSMFDEHITGRASEVLPEYIEKLIQ
jgi:NAD-dependent deacetylase